MFISLAAAQIVDIAIALAQCVCFTVGNRYVSAKCGSSRKTQK